MAKNTTMRKVSLRNIAAHKLRLALTLVAVVLGTAFISGAFMFTNSLGSAFDSAVASEFDGVDAVASPDDEAEPPAPGITPEMRDEINNDPDVKSSTVEASQVVVVANTNDEAFQTGSGTSQLGIYYPDDQVVGQPTPIEEGNAPTTADEVLVNENAADKYGINVGDTLRVVDPQARHDVKVTGLYSSEMAQGTTIALLMNESSFLERYSQDGMVDQLKIAGNDGVDAGALVDGLGQRHSGIKFESGQKLAEDASEFMKNLFSFVNYFLVAFGLVALLVGTFIIANTFSMIVAQRTKEFALLRALGSSKRQITNSVVLESAIVGLIGSAVGVLAGMGLVAIIKAVMAHKEMMMPDSGLGLSWQAILIPIVLGTIVTVISAWVPAQRAGEVQPVEAMRSTETSSSQPLLVRTIVGVLLIVIGVICGFLGVHFDDWSTTRRAILIGVAAGGVIIGYFFAGPAMTLPLVPTFGRIIGLPFGSVGKLASTNSRRNPRRTAATAFALTLGIALVTTIGLLGNTMKQSVSDQMESNFTADYVLSGPQNGGFSIPLEVPDAAAKTDGVGEVISQGTAPVTVDGQSSMPFSPQPSSSFMDGDPTKVIKTDVVEGSTDLSQPGTVIADKNLAERQGWSVGQKVQVAAPGLSPETREATVIGIVESNQILRGVIVNADTAREIVPPESTQVNTVAVLGDGSVDDEQLRSNLEETMKPFIVMQVLSSEDIAGQVNSSINSMLNILYALLALAIIVAVLGILNTLTLGVIERRQEIGMLRAVGTQRRQIRRMITLEAVQVAVFGAVMGIIIGLGLGWAFLKVLSGEGLDTIAIPWTQIALVIVGSIIVGILAAIWPATSAAKTPPLDAIAD